MTKSSFQNNRYSTLNSINSDQKSFAEKPQKPVANSLFGYFPGTVQYNKTAPAQAWNKLIEQWNSYTEHPSEETKENLISPITPR